MAVKPAFKNVPTSIGSYIMPKSKPKVTMPTKSGALSGGILGGTGPATGLGPISPGNFVPEGVTLPPLTQDPRTIPAWEPSAPGTYDPTVPDTSAVSATGQTTQTFAPPLLPPPPTTRTIAGHWTNPDWEALLYGDPRFIAGQGALAANKSFAATRRATAIKNAIIAFGAAPKGWQSGFGDLNETDIAQAQQNPYSYMALAQAQRNRSSADLQAELAGRGMLSSGALTGGLNMVGSAYDQGVGQGENTLLGQLGGTEATYGSDILGLDQGWIDTQAQIGAGVQAANPNQWIDQYEEPI